MDETERFLYSSAFNNWAKDLLKQLCIRYFVFSVAIATYLTSVVSPKVN